MLGVVVCPHCTLVQGADLSMARITCPRCGDKIDIKRAKVYFSTDSPKELAEGVRQVGAQLFYDIETLSNTTAPPPVPRPGVPSDEQSMRSLVIRLTEDRDHFTRDDLRTELRIEDDEVVDRLLGRMLSTGIIYEASRGRYRPT